ncbi:hypothetical protein SAMN05421504_104294 [Amycolatopsis xylanica]|uniref:Uncharacterized protein n=1 Tax=Amycolatopsis xylanica TaxID=589385 RepID=A0A1H3GL03_9PSEU|nr:hypothetical protein [Amycolatopsis xylanica]SDY03665.1 hypothetical protein SAMN05421504_104294 [Amycolatopsis xylanica]
MGDTAPLRRVEPAKSPVSPVLKGAGLVGIALVSGLVWWLIRHEPAEPVAEPPGKSAGEFQFAVAESPQVATDCEAHSYSKTKEFFAEHMCTRLSRALYTTTAGGAKALVSVVLVTMPDGEQAQELKKLTDRDGTGNVDDLVKDGTAKIPNAPKVYKAKYDSHVTGNEVAIVMADFFDGHKDDPLLKRITTDALRLAGTLRQ